MTNKSRYGKDYQAIAKRAADFVKGIEAKKTPEQKKAEHERLAKRLQASYAKDDAKLEEERIYTKLKRELELFKKGIDLDLADYPQDREVQKKK